MPMDDMVRLSLEGSREILERSHDANDGRALVERLEAHNVVLEYHDTMGTYDIKDVQRALIDTTKASAVALTLLLDIAAENDKGRH